MAKNLTEQPNLTKRPPARNAFRDRNWEVILVTLVLLVSLIATVAMVVISAFDANNDGNQLRILPAAALMMLVEVWLMLSLPFYSKMSFWGVVIFLGTYLFFAIPFVFLQLLPGAVNIGITSFIIIALLCIVSLFRQRELFLRPAKAQNKPKTH